MPDQVTSSNGQGRKLSFKQLKAALTSCGMPMSDPDFEVLWRRVDKECIGQVVSFCVRVCSRIRGEIYTIARASVCNHAFWHMIRRSLCI